MGVVLIKLPAGRLEEMSQGQIEGIRQFFEPDKAFLMDFESDILTGKAARDELTRIRDEINDALERT